MPFFSADQPLTLPELAAALRSREALRLPPTAGAQQPVGPSSLLPPQAEPATPADWLLAHTCGVGPDLPAALVRRMLLLLAQRLSSTASTAQRAAASRLLDFFNRDVWPVVPAQGSLGATDAVPLAHLCLPLLGLGEVDYQGYRLASADVLGLFGWEAGALPEAAGQLLLNGQEFTLAYATEALERAEHLLRAADIIGALSAADAPYTIGYQPTDHATSRAAVAYVAQAVQQACQTGAASTTEQESYSGGLALVLDRLARAVATLGTLSVQRAGQLLAGQHGLPPALATPQLPLGLQVPHRTAMSLASQNQPLGAPAAANPPDNLESGPDEAMSRGAYAATQALRVVENTEQILGIELLVVAQALDWQHTASPTTLGGNPALAVVAAFREHVTFVAHARVLAPDLHRAARFVREYHWT